MAYDNEIRKAFINSAPFNDELKDGFWIEEWNIQDSIVDMAMINDILVGYEIKSKKDSLARLAKQLADYTRVFDKIIVITDESYLKKLLRLAPSYVGIVLAQPNFPIVRPALKNENISYKDVAWLLYKKEQYEILTSLGVKRIKSKSRKELAVIFEKTCGAATTTLVSAYLRKRYETTSWKKPVNSLDTYLVN